MQDNARITEMVDIQRPIPRSLQNCREDCQSEQGTAAGRRYRRRHHREPTVLLRDEDVHRSKTSHQDVDYLF